MTNYLKTFRNIFYFVLAIQASLVLFGILRPSIIYDYLDNWPLSLLPILILIFNKIYLSNSRFDNYIYGFLIIIYSLFPAVLLSSQEILTTNNRKQMKANGKAADYDVRLADNNEKRKPNESSQPCRGIPQKMIIMQDTMLFPPPLDILNQNYIS